jgi:hypothetical protein
MISLLEALAARVTRTSRRRARAADRPTIEIFTTVAGLERVHPPVPASRASPGWFTKLSAFVDGGRRFDVHRDAPRLTVRGCPGIADFLTTGVVIPLWTDYALAYSPEEDELTWQAGRKEFSLEVHGPEQIGTMPVGDEHLPMSIKLKNPWYVRTPPGVSCLLLQPFYHPERRFTVFPGVVDTDVYHGINVNTLWRRFAGTVVLEAGTPLVQLIPFAREEWRLDLRAGGAEDARLIAAHDLRFNNTLKARPGHYRRERKDAPPPRGGDGR